jgi:hypothetical protein
MYIHTYIHTYTDIHTYVYIYIYIYDEDWPPMHLRHDHSAPSLPPNLRANPPSVTPSLLCVEEKKQPGVWVSGISVSGISGPRRRNEAL